jgi:hypothetical protein
MRCSPGIGMLRALAPDLGDLLAETLGFPMGSLQFLE